MYEKKTRVGEIRTLRVGSRPRRRKEVKWLWQNLILNFQAGALLGRVMGGTNAVTKLSFPVYFLNNKFILRACQTCN